MFSAEAVRASLVDTAISTGELLRRCDFTAIVTGVSVIPRLSLAIVLPVHGEHISRSNICFGPTGSAASIVLMILLPLISSAREIFSAAVPKRELTEAALDDIITVISAPSLFSSAIAAKDFSNVQKEPHIAYPIRTLSNEITFINFLSSVYYIIYRIGNESACRFGRISPGNACEIHRFDAELFSSGKIGRSRS